MATETIPPFTVNQGVIVDVADIGPDGVTPDLVEALTVSIVSGGTNITAGVNPGNNRQVRLTGVAPGTATVSVAAPGVPTAGLLTLNISVTAQPNMSRIDFVGVSAPFAV